MLYATQINHINTQLAFWFGFFPGLCSAVRVHNIRTGLIRLLVHRAVCMTINKGSYALCSLHCNGIMQFYGTAALTVGLLVLSYDQKECSFISLPLQPEEHNNIGTICSSWGWCGSQHLQCTTVQALLQVGRQATNTARQMVLVYKYTRLRRCRWFLCTMPGGERKERKEGKKKSGRERNKS